jgi:hypothetical protein
MDPFCNRERFCATFALCHPAIGSSSIVVVRESNGTGR